MQICVVGLGIMGGSLCMALKRAGYAVDGYDISKLTRQYALNNGIIDGIAGDYLKYDLTFIALPPAATAEFIDKTAFADGSIVSDICGVKKPIEAVICRKYRNFRYVGCHPMAGKEVSGIENACANLFDGANVIITRGDKTDGCAVDTLKKVFKDLGFAVAAECSAETHDKKIAYTSQLAHIVSNAYVKDEDLQCCLSFTGGSFQDMTRIAGVDENMWSGLYLANAQNIVEKIDGLISSLAEIRDAVAEGDGQKLSAVLACGRVLFENCKKIEANDDIFVQKLK